MVRTDNKLMEMLIAYAASHQHPFNVFIHLLGIPAIMFGLLLAFSWVEFSVYGVQFSLAHLVLLGFFAFYLTLDVIFALVFLIGGIGLMMLTGRVNELPFASSATIAASCFIGGYAGQFIGHAIEKSVPVLIRHPVQAHLAAPFFTIVEVFKLLGLRPGIFDAVQRELAIRRATPSR